MDSTTVPQIPVANTNGGGRTIFIGNLTFNVKKTDIEKFFEDVGEVVDVRFATSVSDGSFRGFGHVEFASPEEALKALEYDHRPCLGRPIRLVMSPARRLGGVNTPQSGSHGGTGGRIIGTGDKDGNASAVITNDLSNLRIN